MTQNGCPIRVMVVDDHAMTRRGLAAFLRVSDDLELAGEAATGHAAIKSCGEVEPDVVLMDMFMPDIDGASATSVIRQKWPETQVIALTSFQDATLVRKALRAGAIGFLYKNVSAEELATAIRARPRWVWHAFAGSERNCESAAGAASRSTATASRGVNWKSSG